MRWAQPSTVRVRRGYGRRRLAESAAVLYHLMPHTRKHSFPSILIVGPTQRHHLRSAVGWVAVALRMGQPRAPLASWGLQPQQRPGEPIISDRPEWRHRSSRKCKPIGARLELLFFGMNKHSQKILYLPDHGVFPLCARGMAKPWSSRPKMQQHSKVEPQIWRPALKIGSARANFGKPTTTPAPHYEECKIGELKRIEQSLRHWQLPCRWQWEPPGYL